MAINNYLAKITNVVFERFGWKHLVNVETLR